MENEVIKKIKNIKGNLLIIGVNDKRIINAIDQNKEIVVCNSLESSVAGTSDRTSKKKRVISIKKIRRVFKRKKIDYIICNFPEIRKYIRFFIKDSIYICNKEVMLYGYHNDFDLDILVKRYKRYRVRINFKMFKDKFILGIETDNARNHYFRDFFYLILDTFGEIGLFITDVLVK